MQLVKETIILYLFLRSEVKEKKGGEGGRKGGKEGEEEGEEGDAPLKFGNFCEKDYFSNFFL